MGDYHLEPKMYGNWLLILQLILMGFQATRMFTYAISKKYQKSTLSNVVWIVVLFFQGQVYLLKEKKGITVDTF